METTARRLIYILLSCVLFACADGAERAARTTVQNSSTPGANTHESLVRLPRVLADKPDHLVIFLGMNDALNSSKLVSVEEFRENLTAMTALAKKTGMKSVLLLTIHAVNTTYLAERHPKHPQRRRLQAHLDQYNRAVREVAKETDAILVDWRARFLAESPGDSVEDAVANQEDVLVRCVANSGARDGSHLTADGYRLLADEVARELRGRLKAEDAVACFGDSITYGSHMEGQGTATGMTYPAFLHAALWPEDGGRLERRRGRQTGRKADIAPPGWAVEVKLPDGKPTRITSTTEGFAPKATVDEKTGDTLLVWDGLGAGPLGQLTVQLTGKQLSPGVSWRLDIENRGKAAVRTVTFPDLQFPVGKDDMVVIPSVSGRLHSASRPLAYRGEYPRGTLAMQCCGFYGPDGGTYAAVHDPYGSKKNLQMNIGNDGHLVIRWSWPVPNMGVPGTGWKMPGEVVVRPFKGDWFDIAQIYRDWVEKEALWWPRGKQAGRPDTPDWFKDTAVWVQAGGPWPRGSAKMDIDQVVSGTKQFAEYMGDIPCALHWYNWHQIGFDDDYPNYFPAKEGFAKGVKELQETGVRVVPYINAYMWSTEVESFKATALPAACKDENGKTYIRKYADRFAVMCPATPLWQKTVKDITLRLESPEFNVDGVYLDQISAQAPVLCFDKTHGHPLGGGCWWTTKGYWPMLDDIRENSRAGKILFSESTAEPYANRLDGYLTWVGYRDGTNAIPLFHAVYAGQVQLFGRLYKGDSWKGVAMRAKTAQALVWGEQLGWIRPVVLEDPVSAAFLRRQARLRYALRRYLSRGQMARPPAITTDGTTVTANWVFTGDLRVTTPTVLSGAWQRDDGKAVVLILVNADDKPHSVTLPFDASIYRLEGDLTAREWTGNETNNAPPKAIPVDTSWNRRFELAPMASLAITVEQAE